MQFFMERHDQPKLGEKWMPREVNRMNGRSAQVTECKSIAREPSIYEGAYQRACREGGGLTRGAHAKCM